MDHDDLAYPWKHHGVFGINNTMEHVFSCLNGLSVKGFMDWIMAELHTVVNKARLISPAKKRRKLKRCRLNSDASTGAGMSC